MRCLIACLLVACSSRAPAPATPPAAAPPAAAPPVDATLAVAAPEPEPKDEPASEGCGTRKQELACKARGPRCELFAPPAPNPCRNRGTRCTEPLGHGGGCQCYCDDEYQRAYEQVNPPEPVRMCGGGKGQKAMACPPPSSKKR